MVEEFKCSLMVTFSGGGREPGENSFTTYKPETICAAYKLNFTMHIASCFYIFHAHAYHCSHCSNSA